MTEKPSDDIHRSTHTLLPNFHSAILKEGDDITADSDSNRLAETMECMYLPLRLIVQPHQQWKVRTLVKLLTLIMPILMVVLHMYIEVHNPLAIPTNARWEKTSWTLQTLKMALTTAEISQSAKR